MDSITVSTTIQRIVSVGDRVRVIGQKFGFDTFYRSGEVQAVGYEAPHGPFVKIAFTGGIVILRGEKNIATSVAPAVGTPLNNPTSMTGGSELPPPIALPGEPAAIRSLGGEDEFKIAMLGNEPDPPAESIGVNLKGRSAGATMNNEVQKLFEAPPPSPQNDRPREEYEDERKTRFPGQPPDIEPI